MRDSYDYLHRGRDASRDSRSTRREGPFGDARDLLGLLGGGALVGLTAGLLNNANIGNTGIPMALIPAGIGYAASYFDVLPSFSKDFKNAATGALVVGTGLWALAQGVRVQAARQQAPGAVVAGSPPAAPAVMGNLPPQFAPFAQPMMCQPAGTAPAIGGAPAHSRTALSEAEMISIAQRY